MSDLHFPDLSIKGFRGIKNLTIPRLGRVTLITGRNNTGKSSILEALRLYTHNAAPSIIYEILEFREEYASGINEKERSPDLESLFHVSALFHGFPLLTESIGPIVISTSGNPDTEKLEIRVGWFAEEEDEDGLTRLTERENASLAVTEDIVALVAETEKRRRIHKLESFRRYVIRGQIPPPRPSDRVRMPCVFVSPYSGQETTMLKDMWNYMVLADYENEVVEALQTIDPRISTVRMVGASGGDRAIVKAGNINKPVPLRSFGDGVNRIFAIALSMVNAKDGLLLIDEFENGLHYSVQLDAWRMIFRLAQSVNVQVFATTHSMDTVEAFQEAATKSPEEGALLKLTRRGDEIFSTVFTEEELAVATRHNIEVR